MRAALAGLALLAGCAAQNIPAPQADDALFSPEDFVVAGDACGASEFAHLVGEEFVTTHQAAMPADTRVVRAKMANTLEYTPARLNVFLDGHGRIAAIGCF